MTPSTTRPKPKEPVLALPASGSGSLGWRGWLRFAWRRLTSMRTAVVLLALVAAAAIPGSLLPQRNVASDPGAVVRFQDDHPDLAPWLDRLGFFDVYASPWFAAIYLLLLVSMTGCVLPRCRTLWRSVRDAPPKAPGNLARFDGHTVVAVEDPQASLQVATGWLRRRRFRVRWEQDWISAERGYLREVGNLAFHLSLLVLLVGVAGGRLFGYEARAAVVEGESFTNAASQYDAFTPSVWTDVDSLEPFSFTLESFEATFETTGARRGEPRSFTAVLDLREEEGPREVTVRPNQPLNVDGTKAFLTGHGYAPRVTVRDGTGSEVFSGPVVFLPNNSSFASDGVVKVPDASPQGLGFEGSFFPTAVATGGGMASAFPDLVNPQLVLTPWVGDLGLDDGAPQSVFALDKTGLDVVMRDGDPLTRPLGIGETLRLPDGQGSLTFDGVSRFANFQIARDPGKEISLVAAVMLLAGLTLSLLIRRRRIYVRITDQDLVEVTGHPLTRRAADTDEVGELARSLNVPRDRRPGEDHQ